MSNLLQEIEAQIAAVKSSTSRQNVGVVREIGDGVAKIEGLTDCMYNEMIDFGNGVMGGFRGLVGPLGDHRHVEFLAVGSGLIGGHRGGRHARRERCQQGKGELKVRFHGMMGQG